VSLISNISVRLMLDTHGKAWRADIQGLRDAARHLTDEEMQRELLALVQRHIRISMEDD